MTHPTVEELSALAEGNPQTRKVFSALFPFMSGAPLDAVSRSLLEASPVFRSSPTNYLYYRGHPAVPGEKQTEEFYDSIRSSLLVDFRLRLGLGIRVEDLKSLEEGFCSRTEEDSAVLTLARCLYGYMAGASPGSEERRYLQDLSDRLDRLGFPQTKKAHSQPLCRCPEGAAKYWGELRSALVSDVRAFVSSRRVKW